MAVSEERVHILMPTSLKKALEAAAKRRGVSVAALVRGLVEAELAADGGKDSASSFPFGERPVHSGRTEGSVDHDRPEA